MNFTYQRATPLTEEYCVCKDCNALLGALRMEELRLTH